MNTNLLAESQRQLLENYLEQAAPGTLRTRALILLHYDAGKPTREVAKLSGCSRSRARFWRGQFQKYGLTIIRDLSNVNEPAETQAELIPGNVEQVLPHEIPAETVADQREPVPNLGAEPNFWDLRVKTFMEQARLLVSPGVQPDDPLSEAGRKVWRYHLCQMLKNEAGTRSGEDIEALHDMRVATRRMRAAFEVFERAFEPKALKPHLKGLRLTGRALGSVRDLDVFLEKAQKYQESIPDSNQPGFEPLMLAWQEKRQAARIEMHTYLDSERYKKFALRFLDFLETPFAGARKQATEQPQPNLVKEIAPALIYSRLAAVRAFDTVLDQATLEQFHALRIEFKKLRYTIEYFREVLGPEAKMVINEVKGLQDHLGDLNDAQVASQILKDFLHEWDERQACLPVQERLSPEPVLQYLAFRYQERQQLMLTFRESWARFNRPELHQNLALAISVL